MANSCVGWSPAFIGTLPRGVQGGRAQSDRRGGPRANGDQAAGSGIHRTRNSCYNKYLRPEPPLRALGRQLRLTFPGPCAKRKQTRVGAPGRRWVGRCFVVHLLRVERVMRGFHPLTEVGRAVSSTTQRRPSPCAISPLVSPPGPITRQRPLDGVRCPMGRRRLTHWGVPDILMASQLRTELPRLPALKKQGLQPEVVTPWGLRGGYWQPGHEGDL